MILAYEMGIPVIIMEPLRGGRLVNNLPDEVMKKFKGYDEDRSAAEWALRWIWNHKEVDVILSGMNSIEQLNENVRIGDNARPNSLTVEELRIFDEVKDIMINKTKVPCTSCGYCMPCPYGVNIPGCFTALNDKYLLNYKNSRWKYIQTVGGFSAEPAFASKCTECGKCEKHCPQNIEIRKQLKVVKKEMEGVLFMPFISLARKVLRIK